MLDGFAVWRFLDRDWLRAWRAGILGVVFRLKTRFSGGALLCHFLQFRALLSKNVAFCGF